jgi:hypothetical protein
MNTWHLDFLVFEEAGEFFKFHDRTVQAFFAAYWVSNFGTPKDRQRMRNWVVDAEDNRLGGFREFWNFVAEMPNQAKPRLSWDLIHKGRWHDILNSSYTPPQVLTGTR